MVSLPNAFLALLAAFALGGITTAVLNSSLRDRLVELRHHRMLDTIRRAKDTAARREAADHALAVYTREHTVLETSLRIRPEQRLALPMYPHAETARHRALEPDDMPAEAPVVEEAPAEPEAHAPLVFSAAWLDAEAAKLLAHLDERWPQADRQVAA